MRKKDAIKGLNIFLFLLPALILFFGILVAPIASSVYYSFYNFTRIDASDKVSVLDVPDEDSALADVGAASRDDDRS